MEANRILSDDEMSQTCAWSVHRWSPWHSAPALDTRTAEQTEVPPGSCPRLFYWVDTECRVPGRQTEGHKISEAINAHVRIFFTDLQWTCCCVKSWSIKSWKTKANKWRSGYTEPVRDSSSHHVGMYVFMYVISICISYWYGSVGKPRTKQQYVLYFSDIPSAVLLKEKT